MKFIAWTGTITSVIGAFILAEGFKFFGYSLFIIGSLAWFYIGIAERKSALWTLNLIFLIADIRGIYNAIQENSNILIIEWGNICKYLI